MRSSASGLVIATPSKAYRAAVTGPGQDNPMFYISNSNETSWLVQRRCMLSFLEARVMPNTPLAWSTGTVTVRLRVNANAIRDYVLEPPEEQVQEFFNLPLEAGDSVGCRLISSAAYNAGVISIGVVTMQMEIPQ